MAYTAFNFKTKKDLKTAIAAGKPIRLLPNVVGQNVVNGVVFLEGPHYPQPHTWYAAGVMKDGVVISVK